MLSGETLKKLQLEQKKLDNFIIQKKNLSDIKDSQGFVRTKIALFVEIGELANELKTFKHWKSQKEVNWAKAKEELIDCLHFFLSWTNSFEIDFSNYQFRKLTFEPSYNELLLALFSETETFSTNVPLNERKQKMLAINDKWFEEEKNKINNKEDLEGFRKINEEQKEIIEKMSNNFLEEIAVEKNKESFYRWLLIFEEIARKMEMDEKGIEKEYMAKNKINWERQQKNY